MGSIMLNKPTQATNELFSYLQDAANAARTGNVQQMVQLKMQQNPMLRQKYQMLMSRFPNMSPSQVCDALFQRYGINPSMLGM